MFVDTDCIGMPARNERSKLDSYFDNGRIFHLFFLLLFNLKFYRPLVCYKRTNLYKLVTFLNISNDIIIVLFVFNFCERDIYYKLFIDTFNSQDHIGES